MKTFTLHLPAEALAGDPEALEHAILVRDGFSLGAFIFTFLWFFAHRLWLAGLGVLLVLVAFTLGLDALNVRPAAAVVSQILLSLLIGLEANSLRRWTLARRRRPIVDVVSAASLDEAETKAFARWLAPRNAGSPALGRSGAYRAPDPVFGLFPEAERGR